MDASPYIQMTVGGLLDPSSCTESDDAERRLIALMDEFGPSLHSFLTVLLGNHHTAQDCTQDTFVRAYEHLRKGRSVNRAWLYTVARNRAMDEFRKGRRECRDYDALEQQATDCPADGIAIRQAFEYLPRDDRAVLYLTAVQGLSPREAAAHLGISGEAVRMRLFRARGRLRGLLERDDGCV